MSASLPGNRDLPVSQYDLGTYLGRVKHAVGLTDPRYVVFLARGQFDLNSG